MRRAKFLFGLGGVLFIIVCIGLSILPKNIEVLEKGQLFSYSHGTIYHLRLFNLFELFVENSNRPSIDLATTYILLAMGVASLVAVIVILRFNSQDELYTRTIKMMLYLGLGTHYLALDEHFGIHETIGHNLQWLRHLPGVVRPDDVIITLYLFPALIFIYRFHDLLRNCRGSFALFILSILLFLGAAVSDLFHIRGEEVIELLSCSLLLWAVIWLITFYVERVVKNHFIQERTELVSYELSVAGTDRDFDRISSRLTE